MNSNWTYTPETPSSGQNWWCFFLRDLEIWQMTFKNNRSPLLCHFKLWASFQSHWWFLNWSYIPETPNLGQNCRFFSRVTLEFDWWPWKSIWSSHKQLQTLCIIHMWIQIGVMVRKRLILVLTSMTLTFDLWPWPFAWTSLLSLVIIPENVMTIRWGKHSYKGVADGQTDGRTDGMNHS